MATKRYTVFAPIRLQIAYVEKVNIITMYHNKNGVILVVSFPGLCGSDLMTRALTPFEHSNYTLN